jgi:hypothetical protein
MTMRRETALMLDLETMGLSADAAILSVAAVAFDLWDWEADTEETWYSRITIQSNEEAHRRFDAGTIEWWLSQSKEAQASLFEAPMKLLHIALPELRQWADNLSPRVITVWAKDPDFDCVVLKDAMRKANVTWPFPYYNHRSVRTILHAAWPDGDAPNLSRPGVRHNALDDAIMQAKLVQLAWKKICSSTSSPTL